MKASCVCSKCFLFCQPCSESPNSKASPGRHVSKKAIYHLGLEVGKWQHPVTGPLLLAHPGGLSPTAPKTTSTRVPLEGTSRALKPDGVWGTFCSIFVLSQPRVGDKHPIEGKTTLWATSHLQLCPPGPCAGRTRGTDLLRAGAAPPRAGFGCCCAWGAWPVPLCSQPAAH